MGGFAKTVAVAVLLLVGMVAGIFVGVGLFASLAWLVDALLFFLFTSDDGRWNLPTFVGLLLFALWIIGSIVSMILGIVGGAAAAIWIVHRIDEQRSRVSSAIRIK